MSALRTDEMLWIDNLEIMGLSTFFTDIYLIFSDTELRLELIRVLREVSPTREGIVRRLADTESSEDTIICGVHHLEVGIELILCPVERVGIFHEKFSTAEKS